jgi:hypothetical protein
MVSNAYEEAIANTRLAQAELNQANSVQGDPLRNQNRLVYNAGIARESYFRSYASPGAQPPVYATDTLGGRSGLWKILQTDVSANIPAQIEQASMLWSHSVAYKGMIAYSPHREAQAPPSTDEKVAAKTPLSPALRDTGINYAFQFHYNPGSVSMSYAGPPDIDVTVLTSGNNKVNSYGPSSGGGVISFRLVLNRINDMKYFAPATGKMKAGVSKFSAFAGRVPEDRELSDIYNRGTMYDMEFLFRALLGYEYESFLGRGMSWDKKTADLGWLGGKPVELHLGKSLRYLGRVVNVSINHVLFTERMVPMFSEVDITLQRIPDIGDPLPTTQTVIPVTPVDTSFGSPNNQFDSTLGSLPGP